MKLSICTITYNHEKFIAQALDSFLAQETDFEYEIVVSDDCSQDETPIILKRYKELYPEKIKLILHESNVGMIPNFVTTIKICRGQYIALCEGDDYWTDNKKLQTQVTILDNNPNFSISFHKARIEFFNMKPFKFDDINYSTKEISGFEDLVKGNFIHTPTCVFRNYLFDHYPEEFLNLKLGDWPLHLLNAQHGAIHFLNKEMAVYRIFPKGFWSVKKTIDKIEYTIFFLQKMKLHFGEKYYETFNESIRNYSRYLLKLYWREKQLLKLFKNSIPLLYRSYR